MVLRTVLGLLGVHIPPVPAKYSVLRCLCFTRPVKEQLARDLDCAPSLYSAERHEWVGNYGGLVRGYQ